MAAAYSTNPGRDTHNHLAEGTGYIAGTILIFTTFILYWPNAKLDEFETSENSNFQGIASARPFEFWSRLLGVFIALVSLSVFNPALFGVSFEVESIIIWSLYILVAWGLFDRICSTPLSD